MLKTGGWLIGTIFVWHSALADVPDASRARALELSDESDRAYDAGEFQRAADLVRGAYALYPEPILLYNLGRALERAGDPRGAIEQYTRYLATSPDDRVEVSAKIAALRAQLPVEPPRVVVVARAAPPVHADAPRLALPLATVATGAAVFGIGVGFGFASSHLRDEATAEPVQLTAQRDLDRAHRDATIADVLFATSGALAIAGGVWGALVQHRSESGVVSHLRVSPRAIGLAWSLR